MTLNVTNHKVLTLYVTGHMMLRNIVVVIHFDSESPHTTGIMYLIFHICAIFITILDLTKPLEHYCMQDIIAVDN